MSGYKTKYWTVDKNIEELTGYPQIQEAAMWIKENETVAFPTETVYGLGANALSDQAVDKIFIAKGRPSDNPLIVHIATQNQLDKLVTTVPDQAKQLMNAFWPGPLTIIFPKKDELPFNVTAGLSTVAVRMPDHPIALALIAAADLPIAAPSANLSGKPSPTTAKHVYDDLNGRIAGIIDGGPTGIGVESTVVDCSSHIPVILRPGGITKEMLEGIVGHVELDEALTKEGQAPKSPGMKYRHYAPDAPLILVDGTSTYVQSLVEKAKAEGKKVGVLTTVENFEAYDADVVLSCGKRAEPATVLHNLYSVLRQFNETELDIIYSETFAREGVGEALMNRLMKAANGQMIKE
jgi:L-threonylcarbamoyladenylate synthase